MLPAWLHELRDIVGLASYSARQQALQVWEARWTVELHQQLFVSDELACQASGLMSYEAQRLRSIMGHELAKLMGTITIHPSDMAGYGGLEIRGEVMAIRETPKDLKD